MTESDVAEEVGGDEGVYRGTKESKAIIRVSSVSKTYWRGKERVDVLDDLDFNVAEGAFEALMSCA